MIRSWILLTHVVLQTCDPIPYFDDKRSDDNAAEISHYLKKAKFKGSRYKNIDKRNQCPLCTFDLPAKIVKLCIYAGLNKGMS